MNARRQHISTKGCIPTFIYAFLISSSICGSVISLVMLYMETRFEFFAVAFLFCISIGLLVLHIGCALAGVKPAIRIPSWRNLALVNKKYIQAPSALFLVAIPMYRAWTLFYNDNLAGGLKYHLRARGEVILEITTRSFDPLSISHELFAMYMAALLAFLAGLVISARSFDAAHLPEPAGAVVRVTVTSMLLYSMVIVVKTLFGNFTNILNSIQI